MGWKPYLLFACSFLRYSCWIKAFRKREKSIAGEGSVGKFPKKDVGVFRALTCPCPQIGIQNLPLSVPFSAVVSATNQVTPRETSTPSSSTTTWSRLSARSWRWSTVSARLSGGATRSGTSTSNRSVACLRRTCPRFWREASCWSFPLRSRSGTELPWTCILPCCLLIFRNVRGDIDGYPAHV